MPGQQVGDQTCSLLSIKAAEPGLFWLVVEGVTGDGAFDLNITCMNPPTSAPTSAPTRGECSFVPAECGDSFSGSISKEGLNGGNDNTFNGAPDVNVLLTVTEIVVLTVKVCDPKVTANFMLQLWSGCAADFASEQMANSTNYDTDCPTIEVSGGVLGSGGDVAITNQCPTSSSSSPSNAHVIFSPLFTPRTLWLVSAHTT